MKNRFYQVLKILMLISTFNCFSTVNAQEPSGAQMSRIAKAQAQQERLFKDHTFTLSKTDPELFAIEQNMVLGELFSQGSLSDKQRILVLIASMVTLGDKQEVANWMQAGLNLNIDPIALKETIYQTAPYAGLSKVKQALEAANIVLQQNNIELPLEKQANVTESDRFTKGKAAQIATFGDAINQMHDNTLEEQKYLIVGHLSAWCFGDIFTRSGLSAQEREMIIFATIMSLGGADNQLKAHAQGNISLGNTKQNLFDVAALLTPYVGFPRALNAIGVINQI